MLEWSREVSLMRTMGAANAKAQFLAVVDEVQLKREAILITKNGRPIAKVVPADVEADPLAIFQTGSFRSNGDVVSPAVESNEWKALR